MFKRRREGEAVFHAFRDGQRAARLDLRLEVPDSIFVRNYGFPRIQVVGQLHDVIKATGGVVSPDVQDGNQTGMRPRNRLEFLDAKELAVERAALLETVPPDDFDGAIRTHYISAQPNFAIAAFA